MEAIGQLTGGIAHDFNNLLTVISGCNEQLADHVAKQDQATRLTSMIAAATDKAAALTRQLLAFSRRQVLQPIIVNINDLVEGTKDLLRRTLGEQIEIEFVLDPHISPVVADPVQLETTILNLAINARDAMPKGGKLTIETADLALDEDYAAREKDVRPGAYVMLAVTDNGSGMDPSTLTRAFEPFFTTKPAGHGTGLGLSMVYGFVKQSGGHIKIYSELGEGTTVKIYLPSSKSSDMATVKITSAPEATRGGTETILVVEDDALVRDLVVRQLEGLGYKVAVAGDGPSALDVLKRTPHIDLLFTDVVLPGGMNGRELADKACRQRPTLKILYTSGYTANAIVHQGRLDPGVRLLHKPYTRHRLAAAVRSVLDAS